MCVQLTITATVMLPELATLEASEPASEAPSSASLPSIAPSVAPDFGSMPTSLHTCVVICASAVVCLETFLRALESSATSSS